MSRISRVFIGYDHRQSISYNVLQFSIISTAKRPVSITPLVIDQLPINRTGLTPFTYSRFLVPWLCNYEGWALFLDADMAVLSDIGELFDMADDKYTVMVSKNEMRFEWASAMLFNCSKCKILTPEYVEAGEKLHTLGWVKEEEIGAFPGEWNHLVGYDKPRPDAKLIHYTQGIPAFPETNSCEYAKEWTQFQQKMNSAVEWETLMAKSVHSITVNGKPMPKFLIDEKNQRPVAGQERKVAELITNKKPS